MHILYSIYIFCFEKKNIRSISLIATQCLRFILCTKKKKLFLDIDGSFCMI